TRSTSATASTSWPRMTAPFSRMRSTRSSSVTCRSRSARRRSSATRPGDIDRSEAVGGPWAADLEDIGRPVGALELADQAHERVAAGGGDEVGRVEGDDASGGRPVRPQPRGIVGHRGQRLVRGVADESGPLAGPFGGTQLGPSPLEVGAAVAPSGHPAYQLVGAGG